MTSKGLLSVGVLVLLGGVAQAGFISEPDFGPGASVQDYEDLGLPFENATPLLIGGDTYTTDDGTLLYHSSFGTMAGGSGYAIGSNTDLGYIDIVLGTPVPKAGLTVGVSSAWSASVAFYGQADSLLGTIPLSGAASEGAFAGWQADTGSITRLRITDTSENNKIIVVDNLTTETASEWPVIPAPGAVVLALVGTGLVTGLRRHRKS